MNHDPHGRHEQMLLAEEGFLIQGAIFEVNRQMGAGFLEAVYQECLAIECTARNIPFQEFAHLAIRYKGQHLAQSYRPTSYVFSASLSN